MRTKRRIALLGIVIAGFTFAMLGCGKKSPSRPADVSLFFTSDTRGRLVPCGCFSGQYGGLTRLKTVLDADSAAPRICVDVGNAIGGIEDHDLIQYKYMLQAYAEMKFDAVNLGQREALLSSAELRGLREESPVRLISANLLDDDSHEPIMEPFMILERGGFKIALIGVLDPRMNSDIPGRGVLIEKMDVTLGKLLPELRRKVDIIVLAAFTDEATLSALAQEFYEIDVILGGKVSQPSRELTRENRSLLLYTANQGRALGIMRTRISGPRKIDGMDHEILLLEDKIPENHDIQKLADAYRDEVRHSKLSVDDPARLSEIMVPGVKNAAQYAGTSSCIDCHPAAAKVWQNSAHSHAMESLTAKRADADPNCIACHTIGFGTVSGYRREYEAKKLTDVGCESCHGPGSLHVAERKENLPTVFKFRPLGAGDCQKCHYGEFSRPFDWRQFWPKIQHGMEPVPAPAATKK